MDLSETFYRPSSRWLTWPKTCLKTEIGARWIKKIGQYGFLASYLLSLSLWQGRSSLMKVINWWEMSFSKYMNKKVEKSYSVLPFKRDPEEIVSCSVRLAWMYLTVTLYLGEINVFANASNIYLVSLIHISFEHKATLMLPLFPHNQKVHRIVRKKNITKDLQIMPVFLLWQ